MIEMNNDFIEQLRVELDVWDNSPTECDGHSRVISTLLFKKDIKHTIWCGFFQWIGHGQVSPHYWIELPECDCIIDYRARMWCANMDNPQLINIEVPHGIFNPKDWNQIQYTKIQQQLPSDFGVPLNGWLFDILTMRI
ncbi:MAG: hypothetical protein RM347_033060 [Nostoc sp. ChiQUE02]|nr:hypothetical protein [Nostoc sp. ChiQUE02]